MGKNPLPSQAGMVRRITRQFRAASPDQRAIGLGWYPEARRVATVISPDDVARGAGLLAALSPRCQWSTNVVFAERVMSAARAGLPCPPVSTVDNRGTAWLIATGTVPLDALGTVSHTGRVVSGHKVRSFYANIMGDTDAVTCDMWAYAVATGRWGTHPRTGRRMPADADMTGREYEQTAAAYRRAAAILGVTPRDCQAVCWVAARGIKPADVEFHAAAGQRAA